MSRERGEKEENEVGIDVGLLYSEKRIRPFQSAGTGVLMCRSQIRRPRKPRLGAFGLAGLTLIFDTNFVGSSSCSTSYNKKRRGPGRSPTADGTGSKSAAVYGRRRASRCECVAATTCRNRVPATGHTRLIPCRKGRVARLCAPGRSRGGCAQIVRARRSALIHKRSSACHAGIAS